MAVTRSNPDTIEIIDESTDGVIAHQLYIDGCRRAAVTKIKGSVKLNLQVYGPQSWSEARVLMHGLLHLFVIADSLMEEPKCRAPRK